MQDVNVNVQQRTYTLQSNEHRLIQLDCSASYHVLQHITHNAE